MKFLYLSISSFIIIACVTLTRGFGIFHKPHPKTDKVLSVQAQVYNGSPKPVLVSSEPIKLSSYAVLAVDVDSQVTLYEKNSDIRLLPASTTKIVTALVALDYYPLDQTIRVPSFSIEGQKMHLVAGEEISVRNLIYGLLVNSGNDAAEALARNYPGGRESFIAAMNLKIQELGLENTYFENPTGFDGSLQYTTAKDLVKIAIYAMENRFIRQVVATKEITVGSQDGKLIHKLTNINRLVGEVEGVIGIKTGWTENARENLVTCIERGDRKIITVVLSGQDRFGDTETLIDWIFKNYSWEVDEG